MTSTAVAPTNAATAQFTAPTKGASNTPSSPSSSGTSGASGASGATGTSSASANSISINGGLASLAGNFQSFLSLLTTQLQNQDPLNPTDTNQFTQQITQMTGVEQQLISNQLLQQLVSQQTGVAAAAGMIGDKITAPGAKSSDPAITGTVTAVSQSNGQTLLTVGANQVPLSSITSVTGTSNPLASLLGG
jgi:flagellar basal-body rod modification protein FlgD